MHRINRVEIEIEAADLALARTLLERVSGMRAPAIAPLIDRVCSELSGLDQVERIERLELDIGVLRAEGFEADFIEKLEPALRAALMSALRGRAGREPRARDSLELLETFALTGQLPWWAERDRDVVARHFAHAAATAEGELVGLVRRIARDPGALERIARSCDPETLAACMRRAGPADTPPTDATRAGASDRTGVRSERGSGSIRGSDVGVRSENLPGTESSSERSGTGSATAAGAGVRAAEDHVAVASKPGAGAVRDEERREDQSAYVALPAASSRDPRRAIVADAGETPVGSIPGPGSAIRGQRRRALARLDEVYVDDAGLVIAWPFLQRFFARVGLLGDDHRFPDEDAAVQAVALVETLVEPGAELLEFKLSLAKVLCGLPLESDLPPVDAPTADQLAEGDLLLAAVIDHARVLGDMSIGGLQTMFLQRRAALTTRDGAWLLQVERQAHDVLLDRFPWSWSWVKLPWMPGPLRVEW